LTSVLDGRSTRTTIAYPVTASGSPFIGPGPWLNAGQGSDRAGTEALRARTAKDRVRSARATGGTTHADVSKSAAIFTVALHIHRIADRQDATMPIRAMLLG